MNQFNVIKPGRDREFLGCFNRRGCNTNEYSVKAVIQQQVLIHVRTHAIIVRGERSTFLKLRCLITGFFKAVGSRANC